jgi:serine/threonine protein kinase HipA of HipAB toxin-antitoxin module
MIELNELRKAAAYYGYALVDKERIKHLSVHCICDLWRPIVESIEIKNMARANVIALAAREIHTKLLEFDKYLITESDDAPYTRLTIELDVIVPKQRGG